MKYQETKSGGAPNAQRQAHADQTEELARLALLNQSAWELRLSDIPKARTLALEAKELATELNDPAELAQSLITLSVAIFRESDIQAALAAGEEAYQLTDALPKSTRQNLLLRAVNFLIGVHYRLGNYAVALDLYLKHLDEISTGDAKQDQANLFNNLSGIYGALGDYAMAMSMLEQTIDIRRETNDHQGLATALLNMGNVCLRQRRFEDALRTYTESLQCAQKANLNREQGAAYYAIGNVYAEQEQYEEAVANFEKALSITTAERDENNRTFTLQAIGKIYAKKTFVKFNIDTAVTFLNDALKEAESLQNKRAVYSILKELATAYESAGKFEEALRYERAYRDLRDEIVGEEQQKRTQSLMILHQTEQAKKDAELERLKNIELADALKKVEEANAFKTELLGIAAHDLKNPLQVIQGFAALIEESEMGDQAKQYATLIQSSSARMLKLIKDLLETAALDSGKLDLNKIPVNLADLLRAVAEHNRPNAEKKSQTIELDLEDDLVEIDLERMREVFENLVSNAVKYSPNGKRIVVGSRRSELGVEVFVKDEGQGLTEEDKQKLFGKFQRLSARPTGGESSTGLGLSIVKQLVELHGSKVWAESDGKDKGTTFFVALPLVSLDSKGETIPDLAESEPSVEETKERVSLAPIRVVLIEDNLELLEELARQFTRDARFTLSGKYDSAELALALLEEVDVVLMDIGLPGISGIDAIQKIKEDFPNAKIVMLTVQDDDRHISRALIAGAHGYLTKQTALPKILDAVVDAFQCGMPMSPSVAKRVSNFYVKFAPQENSEVMLSFREKEVLTQLIQGGTIEQIAKRLFISSDTARNHLRKIYEKMHVHSRSEAVKIALKQGLI